MNYETANRVMVAQQKRRLFLAAQDKTDLCARLIVETVLSGDETHLEQRYRQLQREEQYAKKRWYDALNRIDPRSQQECPHAVGCVPHARLWDHTPNCVCWCHARDILVEQPTQPRRTITLS